MVIHFRLARTTPPIQSYNVLLLFPRNSRRSMPSVAVVETPQWREYDVHDNNNFPRMTAATTWGA